MMGWEPIETAPRGKEVLILIPHLDGWAVHISMWVTYEGEEDEGYWCCPFAVGHQYERPYYWMQLAPLPILPKMEPVRALA